MAFTLMITSAFAGEMKKIDQETRETIAEEYFFGDTEEEYQNYIQNEIMNLEIIAPGVGEEECLVVVTGIATSMYSPELDMYKFWVCITRDAEKNYYGDFLRDEKVEI